MKRPFLTFIFWTAFFAISLAQNNAVAPKIIKTTPGFGDCNVDPDVKEIVINFDQDMSSGMSLVDTKFKPQSTSTPRWIDNRTFSIPVKLYPGKLYLLAFNNQRFRNFKNLNGIPLIPDELIFRTRDTINSHSDKQSSTLANKQAFKEFNDLFPAKYSYAAIKGVDWKKVMRDNQSELENSGTTTEFALKLIKLLKLANDPHMWVEIEGQKFQTDNTKFVNSNSNINALFSSLQDRKTSSSLSVISGVYDSVGYFSIRDWNTDLSSLKLKAWGDSQNTEYPAMDVLKDLLKYPELIIDVRENGGGKEDLALNFASLFASNSVPYEKILTYNEKTGKFDREIFKKLQISANNFKYNGKIYVLSGPLVMSTNESFILMMKQLQNAQVVGMKTYGSSGNPMPYTLSNGITLYIPSWQAYTLEGKLIESNGIEPDIEILFNKEDFQKKDVLFEKVMSLIKEKK
jgi:hypothetical protein